jgi:hypothetical protein
LTILITAFFWTGDVIIPANLHRKGVYHQMALIIAEGPTERVIHVQLPTCVKNGVCDMFPAEDGNYMGHMEY